jgi:hypothetical protein
MEMVAASAVADLWTVHVVLWMSREEGEEVMSFVVVVAAWAWKSAEDVVAVVVGAGIGV